MAKIDKKEKRIPFLFLIIFLILAAGITIVGYLYYINYEKQYRTEIENQLSSIAELKVSELVQWRKERLGVAEIFYKNTEFSGLVKHFFDNQNNFDAKKRIQVWLEHIHTAYQYNRVCLHDNKGNERFLFPNTLGLHSSNFHKRISDVIKSGKITFEDFYLNEQDKHIYLNISIPLFDTENNNRVIGILAMRIDPEQYLYPLINKWPTPSKTAETLLIRREGNEAVFLNQLRFQKNTALNLRRPLTELNSPAVQAALGKKEIMEGIDYRGIPVIAYVCPIANSPWSLVVRMDISEVYAPLREWLWAIIILVVGLLIGSGASIGLVWRQQGSKFYTERYQSTEKIRELNRVYAVLSEINQAIVRIRKPQELFEKACDIAVEKGGFQMAWIGKINSLTKTVDLVASKGVSEEHLKKIDFNCEGDESLLGIAGRVIRTGVHVISNDIQNDESILPQHKESVMYGSKSFAAFPLIVFGQIWGVFKLYSREIGFFDKEESKLLDELAMDISFTIEVVGKEAEHKRAEEEIAMLAHSLKSINECVSITDLEDKIIFVNESFLKTYGYDENELVGKHVSIVRSINNPPELVKEISPTTKRGGWSGELWNKRKDGSEFPIYLSTTIINDKDSKPIGLIGVAADITERKRANKELLFQNEEKEKRAAELIIANKELLFQNEEKEKRAAELIIANKELLFQNEEKEKRAAELIIANKELLFQNEEKEKRAAELIIANKELLFQNEEKEKRAAELIIAKERAEQSDKLKSEFLHQMSHEIRSPMNAVLSFTQLLKEEMLEQLTPDFLEYFDGIDSAGHRLIRTVDLILNVSEMKVGTYKPSFSEFDLLKEIIGKIKNENMKIIEDKGLKFNFFSDLSEAVIVGDQYSIYQIFVNLIDNSIKYTKKGYISINVTKNEQGINVIIEDTGIGISEDFMQMMFRPFMQEERGYSRIYDGNGLGLALVKKYCDLNHITISVESEKGVGTKFTLLFTRTK